MDVGLGGYAGHWEAEKQVCINCLYAYSCCWIPVKLNIARNLPRDPWFTPREMRYLTERIKSPVLFPTDAAEPPRLEPSFLLNLIVQEAGKGHLRLSSGVCFCGMRTARVQKAESTSDGTVTLEVIRGTEAEVHAAMQRLEDRRGVAVPSVALEEDEEGRWRPARDQSRPPRQAPQMDRGRD